MSQPTVPRNRKQPTQTTRMRQRAFRQIRGALAGVEAEVVARFERIEVATANADGQVYEYLLDANILDNLNAEIADIIERLIMRAERGEPIVIDQVALAYEQGTAYNVANLAAQSEAYRRTLEQTLMLPHYRTRIGLVRARVFEEMRGFTDQTRTDLARTLADGMTMGRSPRDIAIDIQRRVGVAQSRAERIARTEINNAHRRAIRDEDERTNDEGIHTRLLWLSALSPTTRPNHASRHGRTYTRQEVDEFYARDGNAVNCKCSQTSILTDENGKPLSDKLPERLRLEGATFFPAAA